MCQSTLVARGWVNKPSVATLQLLQLFLSSFCFVLYKDFSPQVCDPLTRSVRSPTGRVVRCFHRTRCPCRFLRPKSRRKSGKKLATKQNSKTQAEKQKQETLKPWVGSYQNATAATEPALDENSKHHLRRIFSSHETIKLYHSNWYYSSCQQQQRTSRSFLLTFKFAIIPSFHSCSHSSDVFTH